MEHIGKDLDEDAINAFVADAHRPLEALVHTFCDEAYEAIMTSAQNYLASNLTYNLASTLATAERERRSAWERADALKQQNADLLEALDNAARWIESVRKCELDDIVADGGITAGMVVQQEAALQSSRARAAILKTKDTSHG